MGLSVKKLLEVYFQKPGLQDALDSIHEPISGNNAELIRRIMKEWESHGRNKYDLLVFLERPVIADICDAYNLDSRGSKDALIKRIKKEGLLEDDLPTPSSLVDDRLLDNKKTFEKMGFRNPESKKEEIPKKDSRNSEHQKVNPWIKWGTILTGIIVLLTIIGLLIPYLNQHQNIESTNDAVNNSGSVAQSNGQSGSVTANSINNSIINEGTVQLSKDRAIINPKDITNDGQIDLPINLKNQTFYEDKILLSGALPSNGVIYAKLVNVTLPQYNESLFTLSTPILIRSIPPQYVNQGNLSLIISFDMMENAGYSSEYGDRKDVPRYGILWGNATYQFIYQSVHDYNQTINFTDPIKILVKGCEDDLKDVPCN